MSDNDWKARVASIQDPLELLREIVDANRQGFLGHDPYYADLKLALMRRAEELANPGA